MKYDRKTTFLWLHLPLDAFLAAIFA